LGDKFLPDIIGFGRMRGEERSVLYLSSQSPDKISQSYLIIIMVADPNPVPSRGDHPMIIEIYAEQTRVQICDMNSQR